MGAQICKECRRHHRELVTLNAAKNGHIDCLRIAHDLCFPWHNETTFVAAEFGNFECLKWAFEHGAPMHSLAARIAVEKGDYESTVYAYERCAHWTDTTTWFAARYGHLKCLAYAHEHGAPIDGYTITGAFVGGHFDCLQYCYNHGLTISCDPYICIRALESHFTSNSQRSVVLMYIEPETLNFLWRFDNIWPIMIANGLCPPAENTNQELKEAWQQFVKSRLHIYMEELMAAAWRPKRMFDWCLDISEQREMRYENI